MLPNAIVSKSRTNSKQRGEHRLGTTGAGGILVGTTFYPSFVFDVRHDYFRIATFGNSVNIFFERFCRIRESP
jgi:hypothetical protein